MAAPVPALVARTGLPLPGSANRPLVILLAFGEERVIGATIAEVRAVLPDTDVLVVDDGSPDRTAEVALAAGATVVRHPFNLGVAAAESTGLRYAARRGYRTALRMDGDGQHDPADARALLGAIASGAELAIGVRSGGAGFQSTFARRAGSRLLRAVLSTTCGRVVTDPTSGYRAFGGRALDFFARQAPHGYPEPESLVWAIRNGFDVREVAVTMRPRQGGRSSLTASRSAYYMVKVALALLLDRLRG